jgi:hypothetical protein
MQHQYQLDKPALTVFYPWRISESCLPSRGATIVPYVLNCEEVPLNGAVIDTVYKSWPLRIPLYQGCFRKPSEKLRTRSIRVCTFSSFLFFGFKSCSGVCINATAAGGSCTTVKSIDHANHVVAACTTCVQHTRSLGWCCTPKRRKRSCPWYCTLYSNAWCCSTRCIQSTLFSPLIASAQ